MASVSVNKFIYYMILILSFATQSFAASSSQDVLAPSHKSFQVFKLKNGLTVVLKKTSFDPGQIFIRMVASGGYASLPRDLIPAAILSTYAALETGFGEISADHFYSEDIELSFDIMPYARNIQGSSTIYEFDKLLNYINQFFKIESFTQKAFDLAKEREIKHIIRSKNDPEQILEKALLEINTQNFELLQPLQVKDIEKANLKVSQAIFKGFFANPGDYTLVVVGDFDQKKVLAEIEKYIESIPVKKSPYNFSSGEVPTFPKNNPIKQVDLKDQNTSIAYITFSLASLDFEIYSMFYILEDYIKDYLNEKLNQRYGDLGLEVFYVNPIFPRTNLPLFVIQYRSNVDLIRRIQSTIIEEIQLLCKKKITEKHFEDYKEKWLNEDPFWLRDNFHWLAVISEFNALKWPISEINETRDDEKKQLTFIKFNRVIHEVFCKNNYTFLYSTP